MFSKNHWLMLGIIPLSLAWIWILGQVGAHWPDFLPNWVWRLFGSVWLVAYFYLCYRLCKPAIKELIDSVRKNW